MGQLCCREAKTYNMDVSRSNKNLKLYEDRETRFRNKLKNEKHTCITIIETIPSQTLWCKHNKCVGYISNDQNFSEYYEQK